MSLKPGAREREAVTIMDRSRRILLADGMSEAVKKLLGKRHDSIVQDLQARLLHLLYDQSTGGSGSLDAGMVGKTISHYRILDKIGQGGMGVVYKAEDTRLHRTVALKFLRLQAEGFKNRLFREAVAAAALDHPNICTIHEVDEVHDQVFLAMAYVKGESLAKKVRRRPLPLEEVLHIAIQIAEGLHAAHCKRIVHRDVKSANIMISGDGRVKIMDFGMARLAGGTKLTQSGTILGTPSYMSPEQIRAGKVDHRTDIWSLGVVIYEMLTGHVPFRGHSPESLALAIQGADPQRVTAQRADVPLALEWILNKALAKRPDDRYQQAKEMAVDLRSVDRQSNPRIAGRNASAHVSHPAAAGTPWDEQTTAPGVRTWLARICSFGPASRRTALMMAMSIGLLAVAAAFLGWTVHSETTGSGASPPSVVVLMDTPAPGGVFDDKTRSNSGTNADDLDAILRDLPIVLHKEAVSSTWDREEHVLRQRPDLIVIHRKCFLHSMNIEYGRGNPLSYDPGTDREIARPTMSNSQLMVRIQELADDKLVAFLGYVGFGSPKTKFLIYSCGWSEEAESRGWVVDVEKRFPRLAGRIFGFSVCVGSQRPSFRDPGTLRLVRRRVQLLLGLDAPGIPRGKTNPGLAGHCKLKAKQLIDSETLQRVRSHSLVRDITGFDVAANAQPESPTASRHRGACVAASSRSA